MIDTNGIGFCEVCGLDLGMGNVCPNCDSERKVSSKGQDARRDRDYQRSLALVGRPRWQRGVLRTFWWLTA